MRTLKTLSLVLALVLCFGLVGTAFAAPANFEGYTDADKIGDAYTEAADVMMGLGIIEGKTATTVDPTGNFTREQAAKIIAYMLMGKTAADKLSASAAPFADVAANRWSAGFVAYCADQGIVSGVGNGNFNPTGTLTGYQFAKMLLAAVGYNANDEYEGASWSINVAKDAIQKGVFDGDLAAATNAPIQRQQAILMAFNTLTRVERVIWSDLLKQYIRFNSSAFGTPATPTYLSDNFGLTQENFANDGLTDETGAPARQWKVGAKTISDMYLDGEVAGTNAALAAATDAALTKAYGFDGTLTVLVNGKNDAAAAATLADNAGSPARPLAAYDGATAQFIDSDNNSKIDVIVILEEYLAYVADVSATTLTLNVFDGALGADNDPTTDGTAVALPIADYPANGLVKGDFAIVIPDDANGGFAGAALIKYAKAAPVTTKITEYATAATSVTYGGAKKIMAAQADLIPATFTTNTIDFAADYAIFLNSNGRPIGIAQASATAVVVPNFMYVTDSQSAAADNSLLTQSAAQFKVKGVLMDGTVKVFDLAINAQGKVMINNAATTVATSAAPLTAGSVYAYTLNDKGQLASVQVQTAGTAYLGYTPDWTNTAAAAISVNAGNAVVTGLPTTGTAKYATTTTNLVVGGRTVTSYTSYEKFPGTQTTPATYTVGTGAGTCAAIVAVYRGNFITNILIVDQAAVAPITPPVVAIYTGNSTQKANAAGVDTTYYEFQKADGSKVEYPATSVPTAKTVYTLNITAGVAALTPVATAGTVDEKTDTYIVIGGTVYYTTNVSALDVAAPAAAAWKTSSFVKGDSVIYVVTSGKITAAFITAHA